MQESELVPGWEKKITSEQAKNEITERIINLRRKWPNGIPKEILDTADMSVEREKIKHPARKNWFVNTELMLDELSMYSSLGLIKISRELSEAIREYEGEVRAKLVEIVPNEEIPHRYITQTCRLLKKILKEVNPAAAKEEYGNDKNTAA